MLKQSHGAVCTYREGFIFLSQSHQTSSTKKQGLGSTIQQCHTQHFNDTYAYYQYYSPRRLFKILNLRLPPYPSPDNINGKSEYFSRPVLVFKKLSHLGFMGIPMTSQPHTGSWYVEIRFQDKEVYASLAQASVFSTSRLYDRMGQIPQNDIELIKDGF